MNNHRGFTLVEMIVIMSVGSSLLLLATGVVHRTMRIESSSRERADDYRTARRLSHDFRRDAHQAESCRVSDEADGPPTIRLSLPDQDDVIYTVARGMVLREQRLAEGQVRYEPYYFPTGYRTAFAQVFRPRRAVLSVEQDLGLAGEPPRTLVHVEAEVGRLLRLAQVEETAP